MPCPSVTTLRASVVALALGCAVSLHAAEKEKEKPASLIGISKEQVYTRLGEPRSVMKAGPREIMFFPQMKVTLRNEVVVETEEIFEEPAPPPPPPPQRRTGDAPAGTQAGAETADSADTTKARRTDSAAAPAATSGSTENAAPARSTEPAAEARPAPAAPRNTGLEIKFVRPPVANAPRTAPRPATKAPATATTSTPTSTSAPAPTVASTAGAVVQAAATAASAAAAVPAGAAPRASVAPAATSTTSQTPTQAAMSVSTAPTPTAAETVAPAETAPSEPTTAATDAAGAPATSEAVPVTTKKAAPKRFFRKHVDPDSELPEVELFTTQTYVFAFAVFGAVGFLIWRARQRRLELAATTVSSTPFSEPSVADTSALFTGELLAKLEWKRFEELVAAYYVKTGVVAVRTKTGPESPVHLKISWKGEAKPFACVQCHASPSGLIRPAPLQELFTALAAADIRRGYVVTNGKFNVEARDYAEEKHFTLLPGDILLEKLNALPPPARAELMHEITTGDYTTPTCPKCEAKMVRADEDSWRCANHPRCEATIPARRP